MFNDIRYIKSYVLYLPIFKRLAKLSYIRDQHSFRTESENSFNRENQVQKRALNKKNIGLFE